MLNNKSGSIKIAEGWNDVEPKYERKQVKPTNSFNTYFCLLCTRYMKLLEEVGVIWP